MREILLEKYTLGLYSDRAGDQGDGDGQATRRRRRRAPITEKGRGRNLKIPDWVLRRLELEAVERGEDKSKIVVAILDRHLPHFCCRAGTQSQFRAN
jgi:hypothetical protein